MISRTTFCWADGRNQPVRARIAIMLEVVGPIGADGRNGSGEISGDALTLS
jgi:hypothetical protein